MYLPQGLQSGWLFDPNDLSNVVSSPAMAHALDQRLLPYLWPDMVCATENHRFDAGQCAMTIKWTEGFKASKGVLVHEAPSHLSCLPLVANCGHINTCS